MSTEYNNEKLLSLDGFQNAMEQYDASLAEVAISGSYTDLSDTPAIPSDVSELNNDAEYQNAQQVKAAIDQKMVTVYRPKGSVATVSDLPVSDVEVGDVYNVEEDGMNYAWTGSEWDALGSIVDLSGYSKVGHKHAAGDITSGTLALARGGTGTDNSTGRAANTVFVAPDGSAGAASWRKLKNGDIPILIPEKIPNLDASKITTGTLSRARGGTGQSGVTSLSGSGVITINSTNATLVSAYAKIWGPVANVFVRFKTKKDIAVSASGGFTDVAIGTIPSSLIPHTVQHGITDNINAVRFSVNDGNSTIYLTGAATWNQAYTIASGTQMDVSITYMLKNVN